MTRPIAVLAALGAASLTSGCVTAAAVAVANVGVMVAQDRSFGQGLDDATGAVTLTSRLMSMDNAAYRGVDVRITDGRALLSGSVPTMAHKLQAERLAWSVASVRDVANELVVGPRSSLARSAGDQLIATRIRARLLADEYTKGINFNIEIHQGTVYLMGLARSEQELQRAAEAASTVAGVTRVVSYVEVRDPTAAGRLAAARGGLAAGAADAASAVGYDIAPEPAEAAAELESLPEESAAPPPQRAPGAPLSLAVGVN